MERSDNGDMAAPSPLTRLPDAVAHGSLAMVAVAVAWLPIESHPWMAVTLAAAVLVLGPWGWLRSGRRAPGLLWLVFGVLLVLSMSSLAGWDASRAVSEIGLAAAVAALVWLGSRGRPRRQVMFLLAAGVAGLAAWGLWQAAIGLEAIRPEAGELASSAREYAMERVSSRRAFASLPLPSHLAALLATALPLLLARSRAVGPAAIRVGLIVLVGAGLIATRSPVGLGLALVAVAPLLGKRNRIVLSAVIAGFVVALGVVVAARPDVTALEPVFLRMDNWRTGVWLWTTAPASGVGVASFAQASQANPLEVGNQPAHAHGLPFEALAELGPVGVAVVLLAGWWLVGRVRVLWERDRALALAIAVVPLHNLVDFSLFVSGVAIPWAVLLGWAVARSGKETSPGDPAPQRPRVILVVATSAALGLAMLHWTSVMVENAAATTANEGERFEGARRALVLAPWRVEPQFLLASTAIISGNRALQDRAWFELDDRRWVRPRSAALAQRRAKLALARGDVTSALAEQWVAATYGAPASGSMGVFDDIVETAEGVERHAAR